MTLPPVTLGPDDPLERAALDAAAAGDRAPLGQLLEGYRPRLERMLAMRAHPLLRGRVDGTDLLQDGYVEVLSRVEAYLAQRVAQDPARLPFFVWVRFIAAQRLQLAHRHHLGTSGRDVRRERADFDLGFDAASSIVLANALLASGVTPSAAVADEEQRELIAESLDTLEELDREILLLRHFEGLTNVEAAAVLGISTSTASRRRVVALERLQRALTSAGVLLPDGAIERLPS
ncbi:MAG: sigma-70 family RNA polymerase sigma factor [Planctomycetota bacterium]